MKCPLCTTVDLTMSERQGVEIDYCPKCRGVWLDRGELDKIIERSTASVQPAQPVYVKNSNENKHHGESYHNDHDSYNNGYSKKKKSFLGEIFDF